jgi:16S rRNA processing protein RimM
MKTTHSNEYVTIGRILKPRGLHGEVKVLPLTDIPDRFEHLKTVEVNTAQGQNVTVEIENVSYYKGYVYLRFRERNSVEDAQNFIGGLLQVERSSVPELPEGVYYHFEIIDSVVYTEDNQRLGTVVDILETGGHDVYVVQEDGREYLIPATEEVVKHIDREKGVIIIHPLEGLLDL